MDPILLLKITALVPISYLLGSIPWGIIVTRLFSTADIRKEGSGNIGAANVRRVAGSTLGAVTLFGDTAKGAFPVWLAATLVSPQTAM
jgi:glycerol-3-phosphate acyltransferase PlsY